MLYQVNERFVCVSSYPPTGLCDRFLDFYGLSTIRNGLKMFAIVVNCQCVSVSLFSYNVADYVSINITVNAFTNMYRGTSLYTVVLNECHMTNAVVQTSSRM